jgi:hypothetical protein
MERKKDASSTFLTMTLKHAELGKEEGNTGADKESRLAQSSLSCWW